MQNQLGLAFARQIGGFNMANQFYMAPSQNFLQTTLNGAITDTVQTITLNSITGFKSPGYVVIDRTDSAGTSTPTAREVISYTGISGNDLTGCTRGADSSTARTHADGAIVETMPTAGMWNSLTTIVAGAIDGNGYLRAIASPVSISRLESPFIKSSSALLSIVTISGHLVLSGASLSGLGLNPVFIGPGGYSGPTTNIGGFVKFPRASTLSWVSWMTRNVVSTASVAIDIKVRGASIFANATTAPAIAAGGTYVSTASIATKNIDSGDIIQSDILSVGANGYVDQITIQVG